MQTERDAQRSGYDGERDRLFAEYEQHLQGYSDILWGYYLYYATMPRISKLLSSWSYRSTMRRCTEALGRARLNIGAARRDISSPATVDLRLPPFTEALTRCIMIMLEAYGALWPGRQREPLSGTEVKQLRDFVTRML